MGCCQCQAIEKYYSKNAVTRDLKRYRKKGPNNSTSALVDAIKTEGVAGLTLLDIGGGVGAIQHQLLKAGASQATGVEASGEYLHAAQAEAERQNIADRVNHIHGNFVDLVEDIQPADIVTLDKVICCYPDMEKLVDLSARRAQKIYGLVYPLDTWYNRFLTKLANFLYCKITRNPFRMFIHSPEAVEAILSRNGFRRKFFRKAAEWQVVVFIRQPITPEDHTV